MPLRAAWSVRFRVARRWLAVAAVFLLAAACGGSSGDPPPGGGDEPVNEVTLTYELKDHAQLATDESLTQLLSYDPDTGEMVFADDAAQISGLQVGDVLVGGISSASPSGFLQRVTAIREVDGRYQLETEFAPLEEAFDDLDLVVVRELTFEDLEDLVLGDGFTLAPRSGKIGPLASATGTLGVDVDTVLYRTAGGTVRARGSLELSLTAFVDLKIKTKFRVPTGVERFEIGIDVRETLDLRIDADFDAAKVDAEVKVAEFTVATIGAGPFWVDVKVALFLGVDGRVSASMTYQARQEMFVRVGGRYSGGRWSNLSDFGLSFDSDFRVNDISSVDVVGYARAEAKLCPYGRCELVGAATATLGLRYQYDSNANPLWVLSMYVDAGFYFEAKVKVWKLKLVDERYQREWRVSERVLRRANYVPEISMLRPSSPTLIEVAEGSSDDFAVIIRDGDGPPGTNPIVVRWESNVQGLLQEANAIGYIRPGWQYAVYREAGALRLGSHLITVTATDKEGDSDRVTFPVRVVPATLEPRIYEFVATPNPTPFGGTVVLTWDVYDTDRLDLVRGGDVLADLSSRTSFTTDPIDARTTLTLRAENANGVSSLDLVVDVLPVEVTLTPSSSTVFLDRRRDVSATVTGALDTGVTWSTTCGRLEAATAASVTFVAPPSAGTCSLTAASVADPRARATASITVLPSPPVDPVLAAGGWHSLALTTGGHVYAWGRNSGGQLGTGTTTNSTTPVRVSGISNARTVAAAFRHSLALLADGRVMAWGGVVQSDGTLASQTRPTQVAGLSDVVAIATGGEHSLAVRDDGTVWAWGINGHGQLGNGTITTSVTPVRVSGLERVIAVAANPYSSYALRSDGTVWSWGNNRRGQLGNGTTISSTTPVRVELLRDITAIVAGGSGTNFGGYALALDRDGGVWAWGYNVRSELGVRNSDGQSPQSCLELNEDVIGGCARTPFRTRTGGVAIAAGSGYALMLGNDGRVMAWGESSTMGTTVESRPFVDGLTQAVGIAADSFHALAVRSDGTVRAWGSNFYGELGNGTTIDSPVPVTTSILGVGSP